VRNIEIPSGLGPAIVTSLNEVIGVTSQLSVAEAEPVLAGKVLAMH
jgi:hypothetical protein